MLYNDLKFRMDTFLMRYRGSRALYSDQSLCSKYRAAHLQTKEKEKTKNTCFEKKGGTIG